jgi:TetR/AcrR family transcriptional regulator, cholesterol catabolism regulator
MASTFRQRQKALLKQRLYSVSLKLFAAQGFEETTVRQITEKAGVGKGTFFNHFPAKENVVAEWYNRMTFESLEEMRGRTFPSACETVCALAEAMVTRAESAPELLEAKAKIVHSSDLLSDAERTQDAEIAVFIGEHLEAGRKSGEIDPELDVRFFTGVIVAVLTGTSREWVASRRGLDLRKTVRERTAFLFRAAHAMKS